MIGLGVNTNQAACLILSLVWYSYKSTEWQFNSNLSFLSEKLCKPSHILNLWKRIYLTGSATDEDNDHRQEKFEWKSTFLSAGFFILKLELIYISNIHQCGFFLKYCARAERTQGFASSSLIWFLLWLIDFTGAKDGGWRSWSRSSRCRLAVYSCVIIDFIILCLTY